MKKLVSLEKRVEKLLKQAKKYRNDNKALNKKKAQLIKPLLKK